MKKLLFGCVAFLLTASAGIAAERQPVEWTGQFVTMGEFRNDTDFSDVGPVYDVDGQSGGFLGARFEPSFFADLGDSVSMTMRAELRLGGGNLPGENGETAAVTLFGKDLHLSFGGEEGLQGAAGLKERQSASRLVLSQPVLGFGVGWKSGNVTAELWTAQAEENSPQGLNFRDDNFAADHWLGAVDLVIAADESSYGLTVLGSRDGNPSLDTRTLGVFEISASRESKAYSFWFGGAIGAGASEYGSLRTGEETLFFWGAETGLDYRFGDMVLGINSLLLSGDDGHDGNTHNGAFQWSGKARSRTIVLTEDEKFRRNNSIAYSLGNDRGPFKELSSGLHVSELIVGYGLSSLNLDVIALGALGTAMEGDYTGGDDLLAIETGLQLIWAAAEPLDVFLNYAFVIPKAGGAWVLNETDVEDTSPMWVLQIGTELVF